MYFRLNEKCKDLTVGICSKFPTYFVGGSRESFCLILFKKTQQLDINVCEDLPWAYFSSV